MKAGHFTGSVILILLALVLSMTFAATPVLAPAVISEPGGSIIDVEPGQEFTLQFKMEWNEPDSLGYFVFALYWDSPRDGVLNKGTENENFTLVSASAYLEDNHGNIAVEWSLTEGQKPGDPTTWRYIIVVDHTAGYPHDDNFYVDVVMRASGAGGVPHIAPDNHTITISGTIDVAESTFNSYTPPDPNITLRVSEGKPAAPSPMAWPIALAILIAVTILGGALFLIFKGSQRRRKKEGILSEFR